MYFQFARLYCFKPSFSCFNFMAVAIFFKQNIQVRARSLHQPEDSEFSVRPVNSRQDKSGLFFFFNSTLLMGYTPIFGHPYIPTPMFRRVPTIQAIFRHPYVPTPLFRQLSLYSDNSAYILSRHPYIPTPLCSDN